MWIQGLIKTGFKATQTRGGQVLTPVAMGAIVGMSIWAGMAILKLSATPDSSIEASYRVGHTPAYIWPNCDIYKMENGVYKRKAALVNTGGARGPLEGFFGIGHPGGAPPEPVVLPAVFDFTKFPD